LAEAETSLQVLRGKPVVEILVLSGEVHPHSSRRSAWLNHIYSLCGLALSFEFLPHTNVGPLTLAEMARLQQVNASMGLMLEQVSSRLLETVHRHAPSKHPSLRIQQLEQAGELKIPFTTGLLLGIGETQADRQETLHQIARIHQRYGHIQEVILQPYSPGQREQLGTLAFPSEELIDAIRLARQILPDEIAIQIPPNLLSSFEGLVACLDAGARDLGGIGLIDEVNPDYLHGSVQELTRMLAKAGWALTPRLPVYDAFDSWLSEPVRAVVATWRSRLASEARILY